MNKEGDFRITIIISANSSSFARGRCYFHVTFLLAQFSIYVSPCCKLYIVVLSDRGFFTSMCHSIRLCTVRTNQSYFYMVELILYCLV